jgi:hypothetical protein
MDDETEVSEQVDGFTSPLQQYETFESSSIVNHPEGPMWWDSTAPADPLLVGSVEVSAEYQGGIFTVQDDPGFSYEVVEDQVITVLE